MTTPAVIEASTPVTLDAGPCWTYQDGQQPFLVEMDAVPLSVLASEAALGCRIYEFLSIRRPGDILPYLRIRLIDVPDNVRTAFLAFGQTSYRTHRLCGDDYLPLSQFDTLFHPASEETSPDAECWLTFRNRFLWRDLQRSLLSAVREQQGQLRQSHDPLIQGEITRLDSTMHHRDFQQNIAPSMSCRASDTRSNRLAGQSLQHSERTDWPRHRTLGFVSVGRLLALASPGERAGPPQRTNGHRAPHGISAERA